MRYTRLIEKIDRINLRDPNREIFNGTTVAKEYLYSQRMISRLLSIYPDAPEILKIAVYAQHINRWKIERSRYPENRQGYLNWRKALAEHHAQLTGDLMSQTDYSDDEIAKVAQIIKKRGLKTNPLSQWLEDVACLVFLEYYLAAMMESHSEEKLLPIIQKTWRKISKSGQNFALKIDYTAAQRAVVEKALGTVSSD